MAAGDEATGPAPTGTRKDESELADAATVAATTQQAGRPDRASTKPPPGTRGHVSDHIGEPSGGARDG